MWPSMDFLLNGDNQILSKTGRWRSHHASCMPRAADCMPSFPVLLPLLVTALVVAAVAINAPVLCFFNPPQLWQGQGCSWNSLAQDLRPFCPFVPDWKSFSVGCGQIPILLGLSWAWLCACPTKQALIVRALDEILEWVKIPQGYHSGIFALSKMVLQATLKTSGSTQSFIAGTAIPQALAFELEM